MKALTLRQAAACENAKHPTCRCRCRGAFHGTAHKGMNPEPVVLEDWMTPLCLHREEWVCERCLKCSRCCKCQPPGALVHRNSRRAQEAYGALLRGEEKQADATA